MNFKLFLLCIAGLTSHSVIAQTIKEKDIPEKVRMALHQKYAHAKNVTWEKEKNNYEANWGGKSGEDNSVQFTPAGEFIEMVKAIPVSELSRNITDYIKEHYNGAKISEAGKVLHANNQISYEVEVNRKDLLFDSKGIFIKAEK